VRIAVEGGDVYDVEPQQLPNLYHGQPLRIYGRYRKSGPVVVQVQADILGSPMKQAIKIDLPKVDDVNPEIERMWAWHRVQQLSNEARRTGSTGLAQDEIVRLCEGYSIVSEYASFIVLENDSEYARWKIERRNVTRVSRDRRAQEVVRKKLNDLRQQTQASIGPGNGNATAKSTAPQAVKSAESQVAQPSDTTVTSPVPATESQPPVGDRDFVVQRDSSGGGGRSFGGGAIDPVTALVAAGLAGMGLFARRRQAGKKNSASV
jgi:hypothetical protein